MAIVDYSYYSTVFLGSEATETDFPAIEARAEDVISMMTRWAATDDTIASLPVFQQTLVKKAICAQVDYIAVNGIESMTAGNGGGGFTVGKVSVQGKSASSGAGGVLAELISPMAVAYLEQSGLLNPQVATGRDMPFVGRW